MNIINIRCIDEERGIIRIYKDKVDKVPYVIGGDTAGDGSDSFVGQVLDNITGEQVAVLETQTDEDLYAHQMYCLGYYYNNALLGIEANFSTYPIKELQRLEYPNMYVRKTEDNYTGGYEKKYGVRTTSVTRPVMIAGLVEVARDDIELINDRKTLDEMLVFIKNDKGRAEAMQGKHDDHVMALAIAHYIRPQQRMVLQKDVVPIKFKWTEDMLEDYYGGSEEVKRLMEAQYGQPN